MRWQAKAAVQKTLSFAPFGEQVNYRLQRHVSRKLPAGDGQFFLHFGQALRHVERVERHSCPAGQANAYEFGAGWDLIGPLSLWTLGVERQTLVDIAPHMRLELVNHTLGQLGRHRTELERSADRTLRSAPVERISGLSELRELFGIEYVAPRDARDTGLTQNGFDVITSTFTLEHVPEPQIAPILEECGRLLSDTGVISCSIDMQDHFSFDDDQISVYNFLRYSDRAWSMINSDLNYQNRLRAPDYLALFERAGLRPLDVRLHGPDTEQEAALRRLPVAPRFASGYAQPDLQTKAMEVIAAVA